MLHMLFVICTRLLCRTAESAALFCPSPRCVKVATDSITVSWKQAVCYNNLQWMKEGQSFVCLVIVCCHFFFHVALATSLTGFIVPNRLIWLWQLRCLSWLNCTRAHWHTHCRFDKVLQGAYRIWLAQGYSVWYSGKYPPHTLNKGRWRESNTRPGGTDPCTHMGQAYLFCSVSVLNSQSVSAVRYGDCSGSFSLSQS